MTGEEAKKAFMERCPVVCKGIEYLYISAIIYRLDREGKVEVSAEMFDKNKNSVTITPIRNVEAKGNENGI